MDIQIQLDNRVPGFGEVVLAEGAGEPLRAVAGEDAVVRLAGAAVVARRRVAEAARAHHGAHHRLVRRMHYNRMRMSRCAQDYTSECIS